MSAGHIFISHGSDNAREAEEISAYLEGRGLKAWIAPRDVRPGMDYSEQLQAAIEQCLAFVVLVTETANSSPYVRAETEMAFSNNKPIFPVRQSDIKPAAGLAFFLKIRHWTNAFGPGGEASMERLALELRTLAGLDAQVSPAPAPEPPPVPEQSSPPPSPPPPPPPPPEPQPVTAPPQASLTADPPARSGLPRSTVFAMIAAGVLTVVILIAVAIGLSGSPAPAPGPSPTPAPGPEPAPQPTPQPAPVATGIDANLIPGRWTDSGDCSTALEFTADGRVIAANGETGVWQLNGDQLTVISDAGEAETVRLTSIDQSAAYSIDAQGTVHSSQRC